GIRDGHVTGVQTCALPIFRTHSCGACEISISRRLFLAANVARADSSNEGAAITSRKSLAISPAASASIGRFTPITPPNADTGSHSRAFLYASARVLPVAVPQGLVCLIIAQTGSSNS